MEVADVREGWVMGRRRRWAAAAWVGTVTASAASTRAGWVKQRRLEDGAAWAYGGSMGSERWQWRFVLDESHGG